MKKQATAAKKTTAKPKAAKPSKAKMSEPMDPKDRPKYIPKEDDVSGPTESGGFLPTLKLLQDLSPELDNDEEKYLPDAEAGDLVVDDGTNQVLIEGKEGLNFVPLLSKKMWVEWVPRKKGGGFVESYSSKEEMEAGFTPGNEVQVSIDYLVVTRDIDPDGEIIAIIVQFNSPTKLGIAREMANFINEYQTMYGVEYNISSVKRKNRANQKFYNYKVKVNGWTQKELFAQLEAIQETNRTLFLPDLTEEEM